MSFHARRRQILIAPAAAFAGGRLAKAQTASTALRETDAEALSFDYKLDAGKVDPSKNPTYKPGQTCANCNLFFPQAGSATGGCQLFMGKDVAAIGWCKAWEAKGK